MQDSRREPETAGENPATGLLGRRKMIKQIKLEKIHFGSLEDDKHGIPYWFFQITITPNWVSSSFWAIHKNLVTNAEDFQSEETVKKHFQISDNDKLAFQEYEDEKLKALLPKTKLKHIQTNEIKTINQKDYIRFINYDNDQDIYFDAGYIELFKITELWGNDLNPYAYTAGKEPTFIIAPCRL